MTNKMLLAACSLLVASPAFAASDLAKLRKRIDKSVVAVTGAMSLSDIIAKAKVVCVCDTAALTGVLTRDASGEFITCLTFTFDGEGKAISTNNCGANYKTLPK
jgi:hypothetical protein